MAYIAVEDIKDNIASGFELHDYLLEADSEINDLAEKLGVRDTDDIEDDPLHYKIKRYGICFILMRVCQDKIGTNNVEVPDMDKYVIKYNIYRMELDKLRKEITYEMVTGNVDQIRDRNIVSGTLYRG